MTWTDEKLTDPHAVADKARRVEQMFAAIAPSYDLNNRLHSLWRDQAWRRKAVKRAHVQPGDTVLDVACGTGDLAMAFARTDAARVIGIDFTFDMLKLAAAKRAAVGHQSLSYHGGDAMRLPVAGSSVNVVSIAFGIRNVTAPGSALREFYRVLRPGGRVIVLEFSTPTNPVIRFFDRIYREKIMPVTATWIARDKSGAYKYLPRSVSTFIDRNTMMQTMTTAGFTEVTHHPLTCGIAIIYHGIKPH